MLLVRTTPAEVTRKNKVDVIRARVTLYPDVDPGYSGESGDPGEPGRLGWTPVITSRPHASPDAVPLPRAPHSQSLLSLPNGCSLNFK